ncbi:hypothetical protein IT575_09960 [bacterium]|nr:hypothetical protein [bacterium]
MVRWGYGAQRLALLFCALMLSSCGAGALTAPVTTSTDSAAPLVDPAAPRLELPALPQQSGLPALPAGGSGLPHTALAMGSIVLPGSQFSVAAPSTMVNPFSKTALLSSSPGQPGWALFEFSGLSPQDATFSLKLELAQPLPQRAWLAVSDYASQSWRWYRLALPLPENTLSLAAGLEPLSPDGSLFCIVLIDGAQQASVSRLSLELDAALPVPQGLTASYGDYPGRIELSWDDPAASYPGLQYDAVVLERSVSQQPPYIFEPLATLPPGVNSYSDVHSEAVGAANLLPYGVNVYYRLRLQRVGLTGEAGFGVAGLRTLGDVDFLAATYDEYDNSDPWQPATLGDRIDLVWTAVPEAEAYQIEYRNADGGEPVLWVPLAETVDASPKFSHFFNSPPGKESLHRTRYEYRVRAVLGADTSPHWSPVDTGRRELSPPIGLQVSQGLPDRVELNWNPVAGAVAYKVYIDSGDSSDDTLLGVSSDADYTDLQTQDLLPHNYYVVSAAGLDESVPTALKLGYRSRWTMIDMLDDLSFTRLVSVGGRPAFAAVGPMEGKSEAFDSIYLVQAVEPTPDSPDDWITTLAHDPGNVALGSSWLYLAEHEGRPAIAWQTQDSINLLLAGSAQPDSPQDWTSHEVQSLPPGESYSGLRLSVVNGTPALMFKHNQTGSGALSYAAALSSQPQDQSDWQFSTALSLPAAFYFDDYTTIVDISGRPAFIAGGGQELHYIRAVQSNPDSGDDWLEHLVAQAVEGEKWVTDTLHVINGHPHFIAESNADLFHWESAQSEPDDSSDWADYTIAKPLGGDVGLNATALVGGKLVVQYSIWLNNYNNSVNIHCAALVEEPAESDDWVSECMQPLSLWSLIDGTGLPLSSGYDEELNNVLLRPQ